MLNGTRVGALIREAETIAGDGFGHNTTIYENTTLPFGTVVIMGLKPSSSSQVLPFQGSLTGEPWFRGMLLIRHSILVVLSFPIHHISLAARSDANIPCFAAVHRLYLITILSTFWYSLLSLSCPQSKPTCLL